MSYAVIIPAFNASATLPRAIESALAQTLPPAEIVVCDDGSTDDTATVAARYPSPVKLVRQTNSGCGAARNTAIRESTATWLAFLDADDSWLPEKMERQLAVDADLVHSPAVGSRVNPPDVSMFDQLWGRNHICMSGAVVRRAAFDAVGGFSEDRRIMGVSEYTLWLKLAHAGHSIRCVRDRLVNYTPPANSLSQDEAGFAKQELLNLELIAAELGIDAAAVHAKRLAIHVEYATNLIYRRQMRDARRLLTVPLLNRPTASVAKLWLATWVPAWLLDLRRKALRA